MGPSVKFVSRINGSFTGQFFSSLKRQNRGRGFGKRPNFLQFFFNTLTSYIEKNLSGWFSAFDQYLMRTRSQDCSRNSDEDVTQICNKNKFSDSEVKCAVSKDIKTHDTKIPRYPDTRAAMPFKFKGRSHPFCEQTRCRLEFQCQCIDIALAM